MSDGLISSPEDLYLFLKDQKFKIVANIIFAGSPGHQIHELDYFLRKYHTGEIPSSGKYLWIQRQGPITETLVDVFNGHFRQFNLGMIARDDYYEMATQITRMMPELGIDVGLSHIKNSVISRENIHVARFNDALYYHVTNHAVVQAHLDYWRLRDQTTDFHPWTPAIPPIDGPLAELLGGKTDRIAVVHFRTGLGNAGVPVPPENMYPTLEYLRDGGYTVVKVGTEAYPEEFKRYGVINYSESPLRNFRNDIALLCHSKIAVINGSGLENIADIIGIPVVSYARWHISLIPYSPRYVAVPALLYDPRRKRLLSFAEQMLFFRTRQEFWQGAFFGWHFPIDRYIARAPQGDEILAAVQEAIALGAVAQPQPFTPLQARFNLLDENGVLSVTKGRASDFFLNRFQVLLDGTPDPQPPVAPQPQAAVAAEKPSAMKPAAKKPSPAKPNAKTTGTKKKKSGS